MTGKKRDEVSRSLKSKKPLILPILSIKYHHDRNLMHHVTQTFFIKIKQQWEKYSDFMIRFLCFLKRLNNIALFCRVPVNCILFA